MATKREPNLPEFNPLYTVEAAAQAAQLESGSAGMMWGRLAACAAVGYRRCPVHTRQLADCQSAAAYQAPHNSTPSSACEIAALAPPICQSLTNPAYSASASRAAAMVFSISSSVCAALTNAASNCDGARYTPRSSMRRKNRPNRAVSHFLADSQSVTGPSVKKNVNIDPTRFTAMPAGAAACSFAACDSSLSYTSGCALRCRSIARPAAPASGLPDSVPAW